MRTDTTLHVAPIVLWRCACGGMDLSRTDYEHVLQCPSCEALANQMHEALTDIETALSQRHQPVNIS